MSSSGFFYEGGDRRTAVDALFDAVRAGRSLVLLTSPPGGGRSAVLGQFALEADAEVLAVAATVGDILMSADQCYALLLEALGGGVAAAGNAAEALLAGLDEARQAGRTPVVLLDDAHEVGEETRQSLLDLCAHAGVTLVLAGDDSLPVQVTHQRHDALRFALRPFSLDECEEFVGAWMQATDEDDLPSHWVVARMHRQSGGWPGGLVAALQADSPVRGPRFAAGLPVPLWHLGFAGVALLLLVVYLAMTSGDAPEAPRPQVLEVPVTLPGHAGPAAGNGNGPGTATATAVVPRPLDVAPLPAPAAAGPAGGTAAAGAAPEPASRRYSTDEAALLAEKSSRFTLQLFASFSEQSVRQFASRQGSGGMRLFRTVRDDMAWYVVVYGSYRNKEEARAAVAGLPPALQKLQPWARSLQGIQDELRRRQD